MQSRSLFRRFLMGHFLFIFLPPIVLVLTFGFVDFTANPEEYPNTLNLFYAILLVFACLIIAFVTLSWMFFMRLRKRLVHLQEAMAYSAHNHTFPKPLPVPTDHQDEIDELGASFNWMIEQLEISRKREHEEEKLRHRLIANISHDLRTPLTILRAHITRLNKESLSQEGQASLTEINHTITRVGDLMDDLLSYTLLTSGKHPYQPASTDIGRLVRASVAAWYPAFEEKQFQFEVDLPSEETFYWDVDPKWMTRVLDNLLQNILRHAADGKYASITVDADREQITIADKGPGMTRSSDERGAGLGLSITHFMLDKMNLKANFHSTDHGTSVVIGRA